MEEVGDGGFEGDLETARCWEGRGDVWMLEDLVAALTERVGAGGWMRWERMR